MKKHASLLLFLLLSLGSYAQGESVFGRWVTIDDRSGAARGVVDIYEKDGLLYGKLTKAYPEEGDDPDPKCTKCEGTDKDARIIGMDIIRDMEQDGDEWDNGTILDAEEGKTYDCKLWLEDGKLQVRGYVAFFFRTQEWLPYTD